MMRRATPATPPRHGARHRAATAVLGLAATTALAVAGAGTAAAAQAPVGLGNAAGFAVLAGSSVSNTGLSLISGSVGVTPGTAITGFPPAIVVNGVRHSADAAAGQAQAAAGTAYDDAAGRAGTADVATELGGRTLTSGVYTGATLGITGTLTLDAQGNPDAVFLFRTASTLVTATGSAVALVNGASACNVFWQVSSSATLGPGTRFVGTIDALASIQAQTGATIAGRLLARTAAVTLDTNTITAPTCDATGQPGAGGTTTTAPAAPTTTTAGEPGTGATTTGGAGASTTTAAAGPTTVPGADAPTTTPAVDGATTTRATPNGPGTPGGPTGPGTPGAPDGPTGGGPTGGFLALTGASPALPLVGGALALVLGGALVVGTRRRHRGAHRR